MQTRYVVSVCDCIISNTGLFFDMEADDDAGPV